MFFLAAYCYADAQEVGIRLGNVSAGNVAIDGIITPQSSAGYMLIFQLAMGLALMHYGTLFTSPWVKRPSTGM